MEKSYKNFRLISVKNHSLIAALLLSSVLVSCKKGDQGDAGAKGDTGADGKNTLVRTSIEPAGATCTYGGTKFESGIDANGNGVLEDGEVITTQTKSVCNGAGALYSNWIDIDLQPYAYDNTVDPIEASSFAFRQSIAAPALTADIVNKGTVLFYGKNSEGTIFPITNDDMGGIYDKEDLDGDGVFTRFNSPLFFTYKTGSITMFCNVWDMPDEINSTGAAIRYVLIPGQPGATAIANLRKMSYEQIAKQYSIK